MQKKQIVWRVLVVSVIVGTVLGLGACAAAPQSEGTATFDGKAALESSCTMCHDLGRVTSSQKTRDEWQVTVDRMIIKGAQVEDKEALLNHLADTYSP